MSSAINFVLILLIMAFFAGYSVGVTTTKQEFDPQVSRQQLEIEKILESADDRMKDCGTLSYDVIPE